MFDKVDFAGGEVEGKAGVGSEMAGAWHVIVGVVYLLSREERIGSQEIMTMLVC